MYNLSPTIFPKTLDTPNKICYTMYVIKRKRGINMKHKLDIITTKRAIREVLNIFIDWCEPQDNINCCNCPYAKTCVSLHDINNELLNMMN